MRQPRKTMPTKKNAPDGADAAPERLEANDNKYTTRDIESWGNHTTQ